MVPAGTGTPGAPLEKPATDQLTPAGSPVAENCVVCEVPMAASGGVTLSTMALAVPETLMTWGESGALSVRVMVSESWPTCLGAKVTVTLQEELTGTVPVQVLAVVKSAKLAPPT